jgi:SAM-dependent methyltransferase
MRLFSIIQWHHFAYMIISLALLGYGISGTVVAIAQRHLLSKYKLVYFSCLVLFALTSSGCFLVAQAIPFNAEEIFWDSWQAVYLLLIFIILTLPFFFAATAVCLSLIRFPEQVSRIYAVDLIGAGIGSLGIILFLYVAFPLPALITISLMGLLTALVACWELQLINRIWLTTGIIFAMALLIITPLLFTLNISPYKSLQQILRINGTKIINERSSPLGLVSVVASDETPIRYIPGLSLKATQEPLSQLAIFTDADNMAVITRKADNPEKLAYLDQISSALPYHLKKLDQVLILGAGGGTDILQANFHKVLKIDAVELNPQLIDLVGNQFKQFTGSLYQQSNISVHQGEARDYLTRSQQHYDLIQLALMDAFNASSSGLYALNESYLYTIEALQLYLQHLKPDGYLAITRWIKIPPRDTLKMFVTAVDALKKSGIQSPDRQLVLIRSWQTSTLIIKNGIFNAEELNQVKVFCDDRSFDIAYVPDITPAEVNRYNRLNQPVFYSAALALLSERRDSFLDQYKFNITPATDDRPYFHQFFRWSALPEILRLRHQGGMSLLESGYMIFIATLLIASLLSFALILAPLGFYHTRSAKESNQIKRSQVIFYFLAIGLAFLFIEIAFMQKFILFLHHPIYSIAVTLTAFLVFAGQGSHWSLHLSQNRTQKQAIRLAVLAITLLSLTYLWLLEPLFTLLITIPPYSKILLTILLIAPLAFFMGMPFPLAMASLSQQAESLIPWAWGVNGCASVISAVLATLLAIHYGFLTVIVLAVMLYISIIFIFPYAQGTK